MRRCAGKAHINEHKSAAQLKRLSTKKVVKDTEWDNISGMMVRTPRHARDASTPATQPAHRARHAVCHWRAARLRSPSPTPLTLLCPRTTLALRSRTSSSTATRTRSKL